MNKMSVVAWRLKFLLHYTLQGQPLAFIAWGLVCCSAFWIDSPPAPLGFAAPILSNNLQGQIAHYDADGPVSCTDL